MHPVIDLASKSWFPFFQGLLLLHSPSLSATHRDRLLVLTSRFSASAAAGAVRPLDAFSLGIANALNVGSLLVTDIIILLQFNVGEGI